MGLHPVDGLGRHEREPRPGLGRSSSSQPRLRQGRHQSPAAGRRIRGGARDGRALRVHGGARQRDREGSLDHGAAPRDRRLRDQAGPARPLRQRRREPLHLGRRLAGVGPPRPRAQGLRRVLERDLELGRRLRPGAVGLRPVPPARHLQAAVQRAPVLPGVAHLPAGLRRQRSVSCASPRSSRPRRTTRREFLQEIRDYGPTLSPAVEPDVVAPTTYFGNGIQDWVQREGAGDGRQQRPVVLHHGDLRRRRRGDAPRVAGGFRSLLDERGLRTAQGRDARRVEAAHARGLGGRGRRAGRHGPGRRLRRLASRPRPDPLPPAEAARGLRGRTLALHRLHGRRRRAGRRHHLVRLGHQPRAGHPRDLRRAPQHGPLQGPADAQRLRGLQYLEQVGTVGAPRVPRPAAGRGPQVRLHPRPHRRDVDAASASTARRGPCRLSSRRRACPSGSTGSPTRWTSRPRAATAR